MVTAESRRAVAPLVVLAPTLALAAACWAVTAWLMHGMDMGVATRPGSDRKSTRLNSSHRR